MLRVAFVVTLLAITTPAGLSVSVHYDGLQMKPHGGPTIEIPGCPSKESVQPLGCSCRTDSRFRISVRCDAARWNAETSSKFAEMFKDSQIWGFQFYGESKWKDQGRDPKTLRLKGPVVFSPLCELNISNFELKNFVYHGYPPESICRFQNWGFNNATIDLPLFLSALGDIKELHFINQKSVGSLNGLRSLKTISLFNCDFFDTKNIQNLSELETLSIYGTALQTTELSAGILPKEVGSLQLLKIKGCSINRVHSDLLKNTRSLEELDLSYNHIDELPRDLFKTGVRGRPLSLNLAGTQLDCDKMEWLKELIEAKEISLIDEGLTYCANPVGTRFIKERKLNLNVDVQEEFDDFLFSWIELPAAFGLCVALAVFLIVSRLRKRRATPSQAWLDESYPREDQPCVKRDKNGNRSDPSAKPFIYREL